MASWKWRAPASRMALLFRPSPLRKGPLPLRAAASTTWQRQEVQSVLHQVAETGSLEEELLWRLIPDGAVRKKGLLQAQPETEKVPEDLLEEAGAEAEEAAEAAEAAEAEPAPSTALSTAEEAPAVHSAETLLLATAELCRGFNLRDLPALAKLGDRLTALQVPGSELLRAGVAFSDLGVLHPPIFQSMAKALLGTWPDPFSASDAAQLARVFAVQRFRQEEIFARIAVCLRGGVESLSPEEALSLLHSHAFLRFWPSEHSEMSEELWGALELQALSADSPRPELLLQLCQILFLAQRDKPDLPKVLSLLERASAQLLQRSPWRPSLRRRVLLLRSALRYLHREAYTQLPKAVQLMFRKAHRMEPEAPSKHVVLFVRKLSEALTKLKIGHVAQAVRGPFTFDIVERDRKIIYECNHFDRFYMASTEKIAARCLQERIAKAMGYRVIQVPHWHWNKIKHRRQRIEYIRMSRYYALKDLRELAPRDAPVRDLAENELDYLGEYFFKKDRQAPTGRVWNAVKNQKGQKVSEGRGYFFALSMGKLASPHWMVLVVVPAVEKFMLRNVSSINTFELSAGSLRIFQRAVQCIAKLGRDAAVIFRPEELVIHGADDGHSAASQFAFRRSFFRCTPSSEASGIRKERRVVVQARGLAVALRGSQQRTAEGLLIGLVENRLVLEFMPRHGGKVRHKVPLLDTSPFLPGEPPAGPHAAALAPSLLARVLDH
ncbi:unnamed protein product, partial [Symbiodinium sp. KB8]